MADAELHNNDLVRRFLLGTLTTPPAVTASVSAGASSGTASATAADITVDNTAGGVTLLASNGSRKSALIQNTGSANIRVAINGTPTATTGYQLAPGATLVLDQPFVPQSTIKAIREGSTNSTASVTEVT
jgi:hypothetical protein